MPKWTPRNPRESVHDVLHDGVPQWIFPAVRDWFLSLIYGGKDDYLQPALDRKLIRSFDAAARWSTPLESSVASNRFQTFDRLPNDQKLEVLDWLVFDLSSRGRSKQVRDLENILATGGSVWKVGIRNGHAGLERRVQLGVEAAAEEAIRVGGSAGDLLAEAWASAFGRDPDYEEAYEKAIKAVEEAASTVVAPKNGRATLGSIVRDMRNQGNWRVSLPGDNADVVSDMANALWTGQESRHGGNGYRKPTQSEAETAVLMAVPLVHWFSAGMVVRR